MDWTYKSGANGSATSLLSTYANGSDAKYNYDYDANGNITRIWRGNTSFTNASEKYSYVYDSANQLVRENLYYGSGNSSNATITYEYDIWGNLLNKKIYAYAVGTLGTARETVPYAYTNSAWKDQLTSYDGESITYDASGNPTNYLGATLVWEGQRLKSYTPKAASSGRANSYVYSYDENGIRTRKPSATPLRTITITARCSWASSKPQRTATEAQRLQSSASAMTLTAKSLP